MNKEQALALFSEHDHPARWEYPETFHHQQAIARFRRFAEELDEVTQVCHRLETESQIQDASFHSQIDLGSGWLRFSNFGSMVSITPDHEVDDRTVGIIRGICAKMGYTFVPTAFAELPYTGENPGVTGIRDWWIRYFDWV